MGHKIKGILLLRKGLDTVESLSVEVKGSKVANFTVLVTLLPTFVHLDFLDEVTKKTIFCVYAFLFSSAE